MPKTNPTACSCPIEKGLQWHTYECTFHSPESSKGFGEKKALKIPKDTSTESSSEWRERFDKKFGSLRFRGKPQEAIKAFIAEELASQKESFRRRVEARKEKWEEDRKSNLENNFEMLAYHNDSEIIAAQLILEDLKDLGGETEPSWGSRYEKCCKNCKPLPPNPAALVHGCSCHRDL